MYTTNERNKKTTNISGLKQVHGNTTRTTIPSYTVATTKRQPSHFFCAWFQIKFISRYAFVGSLTWMRMPSALLCAGHELLAWAPTTAVATICSSHIHTCKWETCHVSFWWQAQWAVQTCSILELDCGALGKASGFHRSRNQKIHWNNRCSHWVWHTFTFIPSLTAHSLGKSKSHEVSQKSTWEKSFIVWNQCQTGLPPRMHLKPGAPTYASANGRGTL